jgi:hypothetical protein
MISSVLQGIEKNLPLLSQEEQLWLIERLAHDLRKSQRQTEFRASLAAMANDSQIQAEIRKIEDEFAVTAEDGLEGL